MSVSVEALLNVSFFPSLTLCGVQEQCSSSPAGSVTSRFVEEETQRSQELLQRLDFHVNSMKQENAKTVRKYLAKASSPRNPH